MSTAWFRASPLARSPPSRRGEGLDYEVQLYPRGRTQQDRLSRNLSNSTLEQYALAASDQREGVM